MVNDIDISSRFFLFYNCIFTFLLFLLDSKKLLLFWIIKQITIKLTVKKLSRLGSTFVYLPKYLSWFNASRSTSSSKHGRNYKFQSWLGFLRKHSGDQVSVAFLKLTVSAPPTPYQFQTQLYRFRNTNSISISSTNIEVQKFNFTNLESISITKLNK